jgi:YD repeat-containing protein
MSRRAITKIVKSSACHSPMEALCNNKSVLLHMRFFYSPALIIFLLIPLLLPAQKGPDESRPYIIEPYWMALNNRSYSDCKTACLFSQTGVWTVSVYKLQPSDNGKDSAKILDRKIVVLSNGFSDSIWYAQKREGFKYRKVGGREQKNMSCDCNDLLPAKGEPNSTLTVNDSIYSDMEDIYQFGADGYLHSKTRMLKGKIKHNNSFAGSWNTKTIYTTGSKGQLLGADYYHSHSRFFHEPYKKVLYTYDAEGRLISQRTFDPQNKTSELYRIEYTTGR